ncbi:MAG TPA: hypothetical protein VI278_15770 [Nitrososphaeraceae archaeon]
MTQYPVLNCPRCSLINAIDSKYCSKCSYPLVPSAFDELKEAENRNYRRWSKAMSKRKSSCHMLKLLDSITILDG